MFTRLLTAVTTLALGSLITLAFIWQMSAVDAAALARVTTIQAPTVIQESMAAAPLISYQGRLLDPVSGQAKPDGSYTMAFRLYSVDSGGAALWTESKSVTVNKGLFSTLLGDTSAFDLAIFSGQDLFLGITVGSDPETAPRQRIAHVAYAIYAGNADTVDGQHATAFAPAVHNHGGDTIIDNSLTTADFADGAITNAKLADNAVFSANIRDLQVTSADLANGAVTAEKLAPGVVPRYITLDPYAAFLTSGGTFSSGFGPNAGIHLADGVNGSFYLGFTIPPDYTTGTTLVARFLWHTSAIGCRIAFVGNAISVARVGRTHIVGGNTASGLTVVGGTVLNAPSVINQTNETLVNITSPDGVTPLQSGDSVIFSLFRSGSNSADTCTADMVIQSIAITYQ